VHFLAYELAGRAGTPAAQGGGRRGCPFRRGGAKSAMRGRGGFHGVSGRCGGSWTATEGRGGRRSPSRPHGGRRRGTKQWGARVARLAGGRLPLNGRHAHELSTAETSRLNSQYGASSTGACREPDDGPVDNTECGSGEGMDSTWWGAASRGPRSGPHLGRRGLGTARGALTPRRAWRSRRRARRATPWRGTGRPNVLQSAGLNA
jgi:hypothetical protein